MRHAENILPRMLAGLLALGGLFWGLLLSPWLFRPEATLLGWIVFGPGYIITLVYIIRAVSAPPLAVRRLIWFCSLLIQGAWLLWLGWNVTERLLSGLSVNEPSLPVVWWIFATVMSVVGLFAERPVSAEQSTAADQLLE